MFQRSKAVFVLTTLLVLSSCGTSAPKQADTLGYEEDRVLGRSDGLSSRPDWARETVSVREQSGKVQFIGLAEVPGDSRATAAFKMSDAAARGGIAGKLETSVTKLVESSDTGLNLEDQQLKTLIREVSNVKLTDIDVKDRYWEKLLRTTSDGSKKTVLKAFSLIEVDQEKLKKMMADLASQSKASPDARNQVENLIRSQWSADVQ